MPRFIHERTPTPGWPRGGGEVDDFRWPSFCTFGATGCYWVPGGKVAKVAKVAKVVAIFLSVLGAWVPKKKNGYAYETHPKGKGALNPSMLGMCMVHFLAFKIDCELDPQWQEAYGQESRPLHTCPCVFSVNR